MRGKRERAACDRCGRTISQRTGGQGPVAHKCPHGSQCVSPDWSQGGTPACEFCRSKKAAEASARQAGWVLDIDRPDIDGVIHDFEGKVRS